MVVLAWIGMVLGLAAGQSTGASTPPAYLREGDRVERDFRDYRDRLQSFFSTLQAMIARDIPVLLNELQDPPPQPVIYGYQLLPRIVANSAAEHKPVTSFSYSWPITRGYINNEGIKLNSLEAQLQTAAGLTGIAKSGLVLSLIGSYKELVDNQRVIDQYVQYNRLWQRTIAGDRRQYDEMTKLYGLLQSADANTAVAIRALLGKPLVPSSVTAVRDEENHQVVLHVPIYTDIESDTFLAQAKAVFEEVWQAKDEETKYSVEVEIRKVPAAVLYEDREAPKRGDHFDVRVHVAHFPVGALVLTTGAEITNAVVKRDIALGPGDISMRTLAHEFGHLLGFPDGYIRGYKDLGEMGFEILELTPGFDDIMTSPRDGKVQPAHFKLILETIQKHDDSDTQ